MTTFAGVTPLGRDVNVVLAAQTPFRISRPVVDQFLAAPSGARVKTVRGGQGTLQNQDGGGAVRLDYSNEQFGGAAALGQIAFEQEAAGAIILFGSRAPQAFAPGDVTVATDVINVDGHGFFSGDGPFRLLGDDLPSGVPGTAATGVLTLTGNAADTNTVVIDTKTYTFQTVLTDVDGNVLIGATASDSIDNLIAAIILGAGAGTLYATSTTLHSTVTAAAGAGDTMDATAKSPGTAGNAIATTETLASGSWAAGTLLGGLDDGDPFVIRVDDDNFQLATTRANALADIAVDLTDQGTGTHTITGVHNVAFPPTATLLDGSAGLQLPAASSLVIPMPKDITLVGDTGAITRFYFV